MKNRKAIIGIFLVAVLLRIGGNVVREKVFFHKPVLFFNDSYRKQIVSDSIWYDGTARGFLLGKGLMTIGPIMTDDGLQNDCYFEFPFWMHSKHIDGPYYTHMMIPPLYPLFLAACYYLFGFNTLAYLIPQVILSALTCVIIYYIAKEIFDEKAAIMSGYAVALYPDLIFWTNMVRVETLFIFFLAAAFWIFIKGSMLKKESFIYIASIVFGIACLVRVTLIPFIPILFILEAIFFSEDKIRNLKVAVVSTLIMILVLLPWSVRNFLVFGNFTPFTDEVESFLCANYPNMISEFRQYHRTYDNFLIRIVVFIKNYPYHYFVTSLKRFIMFWSPYTEPMKMIARVYKNITWIAIFPLAFFGMAISIVKKVRCAFFLMVFILFHSLFHAASVVDNGLAGDALQDHAFHIEPFIPERLRFALEVSGGLLHLFL